MAEFFGVGLGSITGIGSTVIQAFLYSMIFAFIAIILGFGFWLQSFKHTVIFRVITKQGKYIRMMKAKTVRHKGATYWQIRSTQNIFRRWLVSCPPGDAIHMTKKGLLFAECNITEDNPEPVWLVDTNMEYGAFTPLTTQERALHVQMLEEADARGKKSLGDYLVQAMPYLFVLIFFGMALVFWEEVASPSIELANKADSVAAKFEGITEDQQRITSDMARIIEVQGVEVNQRVPPDAGGAQ